MSIFEKRGFLKKHATEIAPLVEEGLLAEADSHPETVDEALEAYETKVLRYEREDATGSARVLLEASQPANLKVMEPLVQLLKTDPRCNGFTLLTDGLSGKYFSELADSQLDSQKDEDGLVLTDIPEGPYTSALVIDESGNTPANALLHSAKSVYGVEKLYYLSLSLWGANGKDLFLPSADSTQDSIDAILVPDEFIKDMFVRVLGVPEERLEITGNPLMEQIRSIDGDAVREKGRSELNIPDASIAMLYAGFPSADFVPYGGDPELNKKTFKTVLESTVSAAVQNPKKDFTLVVRSHPRALKIEGPLTWPDDLPKNLQVIDGNAITYEEAIYGTDIISCNLFSTEVTLAPYRGRKTIVFAFEGGGEMKQIVESVYGTEGLAVMSENPYLTVATSPNVVERELSEFEPVPAKEMDTRSINRLTNILLSGHVSETPAP